MCLNPVTIRNPTKRISFSGGQKLKLDVPCGKCAECIVAKRNEWYFRTYYEVQRTLSMGGYVYFDTLTYADEYLPRLSDYVDCEKYDIKDFSCFNLSHFRNFLKNLRRQLDYHCHGANFRYFLTSEYGTDDRFTHRPHYHVMFFITDKINPITFSKFVSKCWHYGRTDGIEYKKSVKDLSRHVYGYNLGYGNNVTPDVVCSVCMYVSKYITKNSTFVSELEKRKKELCKRLYDDLDTFNDIIRCIDMFHRQSQGFGAYYLDSLDDYQKRLLDEDKMSIPDKDMIFRTIPLPMYYRRKLYYILKKRKDNTYYWELNERGIEHYFESKENNLFHLCESFMDIYNNTSNENRQLIDDCLDGRSVFDYFIYKTYYQGRLRVLNGICTRKMHQEDITPIECDFDEWRNRITTSLLCNSLEDDDCYYYDTDNSKVYLSTLIIQNHVFNDVAKAPLVSRSIDYSRFVEKFTFNSKTCYDFRRYDDLDKVLYIAQRETKQKKQDTFDYLEDYKERMKQLQLIINT